MPRRIELFPLVLALLALGLSAGKLSAAEPQQPVPRTAWGVPDLNGFWDYGSMTPLERLEVFGEKSHLTPEEARDFEANFEDYIVELFEQWEGEDYVGPDQWLNFGEGFEEDLRTSLIVDPPNGRLPEPTPRARERWARRGEARMTYAGPEVLGAGERCITGRVAPMIPEPDNNFIHIFQAEGQLAILAEFINETRLVPVDGRPHLDAAIPQWLGNSRGRWQGDTLVVETRNFHEDYSVQGSSPAMELVERFTLVSPDRLRYEFTVTDPDTYVRPWSARLTMRRTDKVLYEYACHEGNHSMTAILRGARLQEREAALAGALEGDE